MHLFRRNTRSVVSNGHDDLIWAVVNLNLGAVTVLDGIFD
jgi:hypothetical protein